MSREMVSVRLYEDGTYDVEDVSSHHATARLYGFKDGKYCDVYYCPKADWRRYLLELLSTKDVDEKTKIREKDYKGDGRLNGNGHNHWNINLHSIHNNKNLYIHQI